VVSSSTLWAPIPCAYSWPPPGPCGSSSPASSMPTLCCSGCGRGTVTRWPQASLTWRGPVGKSCRRREFFPYLGFSPLWPKINKRLINQSRLRLKATKPMSSGAWQKYSYRCSDGIIGVEDRKALPQGCSYDHCRCANHPGVSPSQADRKTACLLGIDRTPSDQPATSCEASHEHARD